MVDSGTTSADGERGRRIAKLDALRAAGVDPYPVRFDRTHTSAEVLRHWGELEAGAETDDVVRVAGRVVLMPTREGAHDTAVRWAANAINQQIERARSNN